MTRAAFEITRDSVCMADDVDAPHAVSIVLNVSDESAELIDQLWRAAQLPPMASWACHMNGQVAGYLWLTQYDDDTSVQIRLAEQVPVMAQNRVHFDYDHTAEKWRVVLSGQA